MSAQSFKEFCAAAKKTVEDRYTNGERMEFWHLMVHFNGKMHVAELPQLSSRDLFKAVSVVVVRRLLDLAKETHFAVTCEAWALTQDQMEKDPKKRKREEKRTKLEGISEHPHRLEVINLSCLSADGSSSSTSWRIIYDDMRRPRLGDVLAAFDIEGPGDKGVGMETWWRGVFNQRDKRTAQ